MNGGMKGRMEKYTISVILDEKERNEIEEIVADKNSRLKDGERPWTIESYMRVRMLSALEKSAMIWNEIKESRRDEWKAPEKISDLKSASKSVIGTIEEENAHRWTQGVIYDGERWYTAAGMEIKGRLHVAAWKPYPVPYAGAFGNETGGHM